MCLRHEVCIFLGRLQIFTGFYFRVSVQGETKVVDDDDGWHIDNDHEKDKRKGIC